MDPNANVRERCEMLEAADRDGWSGAQANRFVELSRAYSEWRSSGGFAADAELLERLERARAI